MKCPLQFTLAYSDKGILSTPDRECLEDECALWSPMDECCAVRALPGILIATGNVLGRIHDELCLSRYTYRCHGCGVSIERSQAGDFRIPTGWTTEEQVDGKLAWYCQACSGRRQ